MYYIFVYISQHPIWNLKTKNMKLRKVGWISKDHSATRLKTWVWTKSALTYHHMNSVRLYEPGVMNFIIYLNLTCYTKPFPRDIWQTTAETHPHLWVVWWSSIKTAHLIPEYNVPNSFSLTPGYTWPHRCTNDFFLKYNCLLLYSYNLCVSSGDVMPLDSDSISVVNQGVLVGAQYTKQ